MCISFNQLRVQALVSLHRRTPYAVTVQQPDISICRVFGAVAHALIPPKLQIGKLKTAPVVAGLWVTSRPWVLTSYRVLLDSGVVVETCDVTSTRPSTRPQLKPLRNCLQTPLPPLMLQVPARNPASPSQHPAHNVLGWRGA
jgi:hypothetical protein